MSLRWRANESGCTDDRVRLIRKIRSSLISWGRDHFETFPWRSSTNSFHSLVAEMMLQRTRAEQVEPIYNAFVAKYPTPEKAARDSPDAILDLLKPLGLEWRARNILRLVCSLSERGGPIPTDYTELKELPGIGDYIASAYLSMHAGLRASIIDSNVVRLYGRIFGFQTDGETRRMNWFKELVEEITPESNFRGFNYAVLDFSRKICKPKPLCSECTFRDICSYCEGLDIGETKKAKSDIHSL